MIEFKDEWMAIEPIREAVERKNAIVEALPEEEKEKMDIHLTAFIISSIYEGLMKSIKNKIFKGDENNGR